MDNLKDAVLEYSLTDAEMDGRQKGSTISLDELPLSP